MLFVEFVVGFCASACFFASRAKRLRSASLLPEATRPGVLAVAGFVFGTLEVTRSVVFAAVSPGIVSSGRASIVCIYKNLKNLKDSCKIPTRFSARLFVNFIKSI